MKAVELHPPYGTAHLRIVERPDPVEPGPGKILIRVRAVALNYRDLLVARGFGRWQSPPGRIPASDAAGEVAAVGPGVHRVKVGDRVISTILPRWIDGPLTPQKLDGSLGGPAADGVLAEYVFLDADAVVRTPGYLTDIEAATLPCAGLTAWHALNRAGSLRHDATILVQGTGGVSLFALQFAVAAGARVIATSSSDKKLLRVTKLGAVDTINYQREPAWDEQARRLTADIGVDHVVDVGGATTLARSISAAKFEGTVSIVGLIGGLRAEIDVSAVFVKNLRIDGIETGSSSMLEAMAAWMAERGVRPVVDAVYPFSDVHGAFLHIEAGNHVGKVCIEL